MQLPDQTFKPPKGSPLGTNWAYKLGSTLIIPILNLLTKRDWRGIENLPKSGPVIVYSNHMSYIDALILTHFLFSNGRAPRYLGKAGVFQVPVLGKILLGAGHVPVLRESEGASSSFDSAFKLLKLGHCLGIYPEGTLTRDANLWPMVAKTGIARLAIESKVPVIPITQWGDQNLMPRYSKKLVFWRRTKISMWAGKPLDFSKWYGKSDDPEALRAATAYAMATLRETLAEIRGESSPTDIFDPHKSELPRTGDFTKYKKE